MSEVVHVTLEAPVRHIPRRGTKERIGHASVTTAVHVREVDPSALGDVAVRLLHRERGMEFETRLHVFEGRYWHPMGGWRDRSPVTRRGFLNELSGVQWQEGGGLIQMQALFAGTPVSPHTYRSVERRLQEVDPDRTWRVTDDMRGEWARHLQDFLDGNVVLAGEQAFMRARGPVAFYNANHGGHDFVLDPIPRITAFHSPLQVIRPDRIADLWTLRSEHHGIGARPRIDPQASLLDPAFLADDDISIFIQRAPYLLEAELERRQTVQRRDPDYVAFARERRRALQDWALRGNIAAIRPEDTDEVLTLLQRTIADMRHREFAAEHLPVLNDIAGYIRIVALPRLREAMVASEDAEAFDGLAPGGLR